MNEIVRNDLISVLVDLIEAIDEHSDEMLLSKYSDRCIHDASIFQDHDSVRFAVVVYSLYKLKSKLGKIPKSIRDNLNLALLRLKDYDVEQYRKHISKVMSEISKIGSLNLYITHVLEDAKIKKTAKLIDHGLSVAQASEVLGVSQWDVQKYVGKTGINDEFVNDDKKKLMQKINYVRKIFGLKKV